MWRQVIMQNRIRTMSYVSTERKGFQLLVTHGEGHASMVHFGVLILLVRANPQRKALDGPPGTRFQQVHAYYSHTALDLLIESTTVCGAELSTAEVIYFVGF